MPERNTVFDVDGKIYSRLAGANRVKVALNEVSPLFIHALLTREDTRFFEHGGIDWRGIARALVKDIMAGSAKEGASSITQQLARNSLPLGGRTLSRKLLEAMVALRIERDLTKEQILELYVNRIYFGSGCYGVETASLAYFGKNASKLNLSEAAILAGLIRSPNRFSPLKNPEGAAMQRDTVLDRLLVLKKISPTQAQEAKLAKINSHPRRCPDPGELRDGCGPAGFEPPPHPRPNRQRRAVYLHHARSRGAGGRDPGARDTPGQSRAPVDFSHPTKQAIGRRKTAKITRCLISKGRWSRSITPAAASARSSADAIMRRANSTAPLPRPIARSAHRLSPSSMRLPSITGSSRAPRQRRAD